MNGGSSWLLDSDLIAAARGVIEFEDQGAEDHQGGERQPDGGVEGDLAEDREGVRLIEQPLERLALEERVGRPLLTRRLGASVAP